MAKKVILDALLPRADFLVDESSNNYNKNIQELSANYIDKTGIILDFLRKPDFQRETNEWDADQILALIESFLDGELIPSIILWKNDANFIFVIDGAHRLSALMSWLHDDYGDGHLSIDYFADISEEQKKIALETRKKIERKIGSYQEFMTKASHPNATEEQRARRLNLATMALSIQWINGNAEKAEISFEKINKQASPLSPIERTLIKERKKTHGIVARAIYWGGSGHKYWSNFSEDSQVKIETLSKEVHDILFTPLLKSRIDSLNLPIGGTSLGSKDQQLILSLVKKIYSESKTKTREQNVIDCLMQTRKIMRSINSNHTSSFGFHAAVYVYDESGVFKQGYLLGLVEFVKNLHNKDAFCKVRNRLESFIVEHKNYQLQILNKFKASYEHQGDAIGKYYSLLFKSMHLETSNDIEKVIQEHFEFLNLTKKKISYGSNPRGKFQLHHKNNVFIRERLANENKCPICDGYLEGKHNSTDHIIRREDGGSNSLNNAQNTHQYCNSGFKN